MRHRLAAAAALIALSAPRVAGARPAVALRLAVAPAVGSVAEDLPVSEEIRLQLPVQLDALWGFGRLALGAYGSWGTAQVGACSGSCSASVARAGLQATWALLPLWGAEPWIGVGTGYEWATERRARAGHELTTRWRGFELLSAQGGLEWRVGRAVAVGPFVLVSLGRYTDVRLDTGVDSGSAEVTGKAVHAWIHAGVRARLAFGGGR